MRAKTGVPKQRGDPPPARAERGRGLSFQALKIEFSSARCLASLERRRDRRGQVAISPYIAHVLSTGVPIAKFGYLAAAALLPADAALTCQRRVVPIRNMRLQPLLADVRIVDESRGLCL